MPKAVTAKHGEIIKSINDALTERAHAKANKLPRSKFTCIECGEAVRAISAGKDAAHFGHLARNKDCSLSDV